MVFRYFLEREVKRNSVFRTKLGMQKGFEGDLPSETGTNSDTDCSISIRVISATKKRSRESEYFYGKVVFDSDRNIIWERNKHPPKRPPNKKRKSLRNLPIN